jgi:uncharacterized lipoprotein YajG
MDYSLSARFYQVVVAVGGSSKHTRRPYFLPKVRTLFLAAAVFLITACQRQKPDAVTTQQVSIDSVPH